MFACPQRWFSRNWTGTKMCVILSLRDVSSKQLVLVVGAICVRYYHHMLLPHYQSSDIAPSPGILPMGKAPHEKAAS